MGNPLQSVGDRWNGAVDRSRPVRFVDVTFKGSGQVMFQGNALTGLLFLVGIVYGAVATGVPEVAIGAIVGLLVSTITALFLQPHTDSWNAGLYGYNGILVGAALPTFLGVTPMLWPYLVVGAMISTVVFMATARVFATWGVAALTFPFNLVNWVFLLAAFQFARLDTTPLGKPGFPEHVVESTAETTIDVAWLAQAWMKNIAQIFLINDWITGVIFVLALLVSSAWAAGFALLGSALALAVSLAMGANAVEIETGLFGLSAVLTAIAIGCVFYTPTWRSAAFAALGVLATAAIHATLMAGLAVWALPAGTGPFVFATWLFLLAKKDFQPIPHETMPDGAAAR